MDSVRAAVDNSCVCSPAVSRLRRWCNYYDNDNDNDNNVMIRA